MKHHPSLAPPCLLLFTVCLSAPAPSLTREILVRGTPPTAEPDGSQERPFNAIGEALKVATPGDTVTIHGGVYRESVRFSGGSADSPLVVRSAPGERVVITGSRRLSGWKRVRGQVYSAPLDFAPERLLVDFRDQPMAREPDDGWWAAEEVEDTTLLDRKSLAHEVSGGQAYIWTQHGNTFFTAPVKTLDPDRGCLTVESPSKWMQLSAGDRYVLRNHPALIDRPGEWAVEKVDGGGQAAYRIHLWPEDPSELQRVEAPHETRRVLLVENARNVRLEKLEVTSSAKTGIEVSRSRDIEIISCVTHNNGQIGIGVRDCENISIRRCISWHCLPTTTWSP